MKSEQIRPTFLVPEKTVNFFEVKPVVPSSTLKMRKSHKKLARVYAYTHAYTQIRDGGGRSPPPTPGLNRVNKGNLFVSEVGPNVKFISAIKDAILKKNGG